jgi:hypothetical protein
MKRSIASIFCFTVCAFAPLYAEDRVSIEGGSGLHNVRGADAVFARYAGETRESILFGQNFYEFSAGSWNGRYGDKAVGAALGTRARNEQFHFDASLGVAYLEDKTRLSGTHQQFIVRLGGGVEIGKIDLSIFVTHYSNAKPIFGWDGPNAGYDFFTVQLAYPLR